MRLTLQNRITSLSVISSVLFIAVFTFIQINNQISNINRYNAYQANYSGIIVKNSLEATIYASLPQDIVKSIQQRLSELKESGIIKDAMVFNFEGKTLASIGYSLTENASYRDIARLEELKNSSENKWFVPVVDSINKRIDIYVGLRPGTNGQIAYAAKLSFPFANIQDAFNAIYFPVVLTTIIVILANIIFAYFLSKTVIGPIKVLNNVTKQIANEDLSIRAGITTGDELEELGSTFNYMTEQLIKMKEKAENANPLTKLPGNIVIHEEVKKRINNNQKFMVIYCDLDNFKAFNDKYGIAKGDEAIKLTADIFKEAAKNKGNPDDFIGHEGGDDFILLTTPDKAQAVADNITSEFDKRIRSLYSQEDLSTGFIVAHARDGSVKQFPIMTISLAGVSNVQRNIASYGEVTNIAAEVKKKAKGIEGSVFVVDKRLN